MVDMTAEDLVGKKKAAKFEEISNRDKSEITQDDLELCIECLSAFITKIDNVITEASERKSNLEQKQDEIKGPSESEEMDDGEPELEEISAGITKLDDNLNQLRSARTTLEENREEMKTQLLRKETFPEDSPEIIEHIEKLVEQLSSQSETEQSGEVADE